MAIVKRYIPLFLAVLAWASSSRAQTAVMDTLSSEIIMTEAELESLLTRIAIRKKQQLDERKQAWEVQRAGLAWQAQPMASTLSEDQVALQGQIDILNRQINTLTATLQAERLAGRSTVAHEAQITHMQRTVDALNNALVRQQYQALAAQPPVIVQGGHSPDRQLEPTQPVVVPAPGNVVAVPAGQALVANATQGTPSVMADSALSQQLQASTQLNIQLQQQIDHLYGKLYGIERDSLTDAATEAALQAELDALAAEVQRLQQHALASATETESTVSDAQNPVIDLYKHSIYFANNSVSISDDDVAALRQLYEQVRKAASPTRVVLRGYSSTTGNAQYNVRLSAKRAEAVQDILVQLGLAPANIVTLYHGPDDSKRADLARRVEVTLSTD